MSDVGQAAQVIVGGHIDDDETLISARKVQEMFDISESTLARWVDDPQLGFPPPIYVKRLRYFKRSALRKFIARQEAASPAIADALSAKAHSQRPHQSVSGEDVEVA